MEALTTPLQFERHALEKVWGGHALRRTFGFDLPEDQPIGETWEVVDRAGENSVVRDLPMTKGWGGRSLRELMQSHGHDLLGSAKANRIGRFPVLVKYIDAAQNLSVQVHPDEQAALQLGSGAEAKTEAWYVVDVAPGGKIFAGLKPEVTKADYREAASSSKGAEMLNSFAVRAGDCVLVPGGTVHAIGAGVTILEVQQNSDTTYRLFDWGRLGLDGKPRATHLEQGLICAHVGSAFDGPVRPDLDSRGASRGGARLGLRLLPLVRSAFFSMDLMVLGGDAGGSGARFATEGCWQVLAAVAGEGILVGPNGVEAPIRRGDVWLVPAAAGHIHIRRREDAGELRLVRATA